MLRVSRYLLVRIVRPIRRHVRVLSSNFPDKNDPELPRRTRAAAFVTFVGRPEKNELGIPSFL